MTRTTFAVAVLCGLWGAPARADTLPMLDDVPGSDTPGTPFTFNITLPLLTDFTGYTVELGFTASSQGLTPSATPASPYPFGSTAGFTSSVEANGSEVHMFFSDATSPGVVTSPGDTLASVTVQTDPSLRGPITLEIGPATDVQHNMEDPNYRAPEALTIAQGEPVQGVPAPAGVMLVGIGGLVLAARRRLARG
jgi:hypothetical protein